MRVQEELQSKVIIKQFNENLLASGKLAKDLEVRVKYQGYSRCNNLHIVGVEEQQGDTRQQTAAQVSRIPENKLQLPNVQLERAHRVRQRRAQQNRPIIVQFTRCCDREAVVRNLNLWHLLSSFALRQTGQ